MFMKINRNRNRSYSNNLELKDIFPYSASTPFCLEYSLLFVFDFKNVVAGELELFLH